MGPVLLSVVEYENFHSENIFGTAFGAQISVVCGMIASNEYIKETSCIVGTECVILFGLSNLIHKSKFSRNCSLI